MISKILTWIAMNGAALLGILQSILKIVKELLTLVIDLLSLILPKNVADKIISGIRAAINAIDSLLEFGKSKLLQ